MNKRGYIFSLLLIISSLAFCQDPAKEYFISLNGNLYIPINNPEKGIYPILGYDKETDTKILIGGLGIGGFFLQPLNKNLTFKGQANLSKHTYWDKPIQLTDAYGNSIGYFLGGSSDYSLGVAAMVHLYILNKFLVGAGAGGQILLTSLSRVPTFDDSQKIVVVNRFYKPFIPVLPIEFSYKLKNKLFNIRYEHGLTNRIKGDLGKLKQDKIGLLSFEIGFKL